MEPSMRSVDTPLLRIGYEEWNAGAKRTVVLLHGWPDSPARVVRGGTTVGAGGLACAGAGAAGRLAHPLPA